MSCPAYAHACAVVIILIGVSAFDAVIFRLASVWLQCVREEWRVFVRAVSLWQARPSKPMLVLAVCDPVVHLQCRRC